MGGSFSNKDLLFSRIKDFTHDYTGNNTAVLDFCDKIKNRPYNPSTTFYSCSYTNYPSVVGSSILDALKNTPKR